MASEIKIQSQGQDFALDVRGACEALLLKSRSETKSKVLLSIFKTFVSHNATRHVLCTKQSNTQSVSGLKNLDSSRQHTIHFPCVREIV